MRSRPKVRGIGTAMLFADPLPEDVTPAGGYLPVSDAA